MVHYIKKGSNREALQILSPFISDPEKYPVAVSDYIATLVWEGRGDEAINMYESLPAPFVRKLYLLKNMAMASRERKEFSKALTLYENLMVQSPSDIDVQEGIWYCLFRSGKYTEALKLYRTFEQKEKIDRESLYRLRERLIAGFSTEERRAMTETLSEFLKTGEQETAKIVACLYGIQ